MTLHEVTVVSAGMDGENLYLRYTCACGLLDGGVNRQVVN